MKVLIADDDFVTLDMVETVLSKAGYQVVAVDDGVKAWNVLRSDEPPQIAILDWMMPGMSGPKVCRMVRDTLPATRPYTYMILLTAKDLLDDVKAGKDAGADDYIVKPFSPDDLRARVQAGRKVVEMRPAK